MKEWYKDTLFLRFKWRGQVPQYHVQNAMQKRIEFEFTSVLSQFSTTYRTAMLIIPLEVVRALPKTGRIRTEGTMNGAPFALAVLRQKTGERYFVVSAALRSAAGIKTGDTVRVKFHCVDLDRLIIPEELQALLDVDPEMQAKWVSFTVGRQRGLVHYVTSVKSQDARIKRALDLMRRAMNNELDFQRQKK